MQHYAKYFYKQHHIVKDETDLCWFVFWLDEMWKKKKKHSTREGYVDNKAPEVKMFSSPFTLTTGHTMSWEDSL